MYYVKMTTRRGDVVWYANGQWLPSREHATSLSEEEAKTVRDGMEWLPIHPRTKVEVVEAPPSEEPTGVIE